MDDRINEDKLDLIINMMMEMRKELKEYKEDIKIIKTENEELRNKYEKISKENTEIKRELENLKHSVENLGREKRKMNVVMTGKTIDAINKTQRELTNQMNEFIKEKLDVQVNIKTVQKLGEKVCLIELQNLHEKEQIIKNKYKLRKLSERIYINEDLSRKDREIQKQLRTKLQEARRQGKNAKIEKGRILVENEVGKWNPHINQLEKSKN